jgi:hypothetical protein
MVYQLGLSLSQGALKNVKWQVFSMREIKPLVVTPIPYPLESWLGYVLRLAADNAIPSPLVMASHAGLEIRAVNNISVDVIALLTKKSASVFSGIYTYYTPGKEQLAGHSIQKIYHNVTNQKICPDCVKENGYIDARWELFHYLACEKHTAWLVDTCQSCNKGLKWNRRDLSICTCNAEVIQTNHHAVPEQLLELSKLISAVFERKRLSNADSNFQMLFDDLSKMSLQTLMKFMQDIAATKFHLMRTTAMKRVEFNAKNICLEGSRILADWPNNFFNILHQDTQSSLLKASLGKFGTIFSLLFRNEYPPEEVKFLFKYFVLYAKLSHTKFEITNVESEFYEYDRLNALTVEQLAAESNVNIEFLRGDYLNTQATPPIIVKPHSMDCEWDFIEKPNPNRNADIAKALKIPLRVVNELMADSGADAISTRFSFRYNLQNGSKAFHKSLKDLSFNFILAGRNELVSLKTLMKSSYSKGVADLLKDALNKRLRPFYDSKAHNEIYFIKDEVSHFFTFEEVKISDALPIREAAKILGCSPISLYEISSNGFIPIHPYKEGNCVRKSDLYNFQNNYLTLNSAAKSLGQTSQNIMRICRENSLNFVTNSLGINFTPLILRRTEFMRIDSILQNELVAT